MWRLAHGHRVVALAAALLVLAVSCGQPQAGAGVDPAYAAQIEKWHAERLALLARPDGWLTLAGLYWLDDGVNTMGAAAGNDLVFPPGAPATIGSLDLDDGEITAHISPSVPVRSAGEAVSELVLASDAAGEPTVLTLGRWSWYVIERGERFGVRLRDRESPALERFGRVDRFPVDEQWRFEARYEPHDTPQVLSVPTVLGTVTEHPSPGELVFAVEGVEYRLAPMADPEDEDWFVVFGDATSGTETYGGGRFLWVGRPTADGVTVADFNRAYNPPCAFTEFATCPLPPPQNRLSLAITAGEKKYYGRARQASH